MYKHIKKQMEGCWFYLFFLLGFGLVISLDIITSLKLGQDYSYRMSFYDYVDREEFILRNESYQEILNSKDYDITIRLKNKEDEYEDYNISLNKKFKDISTDKTQNKNKKIVLNRYKRNNKESDIIACAILKIGDMQEEVWELERITD